MIGAAARLVRLFAGAAVVAAAASGISPAGSAAPDPHCSSIVAETLRKEFAGLSGADGDRLRIELLAYDRRQSSLARESRSALTSRDGRLSFSDPGALIHERFLVFDPAYDAKRQERTPRLERLSGEVNARLAQGEMLLCSEQILNEAEWLLRYTALWDRIDDALARLERSLGDPDQAFAREQLPDGSWGACRTEFLFRLDATVSELERIYGASGADTRLPKKLTFMDTLDQPVPLAELIMSRQISNIAAAGVYTREEIASLYESSAQFAFKPYLRRIMADNGANFVTPAYRASYTRLLDDLQDPTTGFWGPVLNVDAVFLRLADLSMTYHVVAYRHGCVRDWPRIVDTLFAIRSLEYPFGWLSQGRQTAHNNYDVVRILRDGWSAMTPEQRGNARELLEDMVRWVETQVAGDGSIAYDPGYYETIGSAYYFTVSFLDEIGYFDPVAPFWSDRPVAPEVGPRLCGSFLERLGPLAPRYALAQAAIERLKGACSGRTEP
jgi:hypothetical protein